MSTFNRYPSSLSRLPQSTILFMWLQWYEVEHGRNHLITSQWCELLTSAREITINVNDSQGTLVQSTKCEYIFWCRTLSRISWSKVNDVNLCRERENVSLRYTDMKVLNLFLRLIPGWWTNIDRNSLIEGGTWWILHRWNESQNKVLEFWIWCNHWADSKGTDTKVVLTTEENFQFSFEH